MQEEVDQKTIALAVKTGKLTAQVLQAAIRKYLAARQKGTGKAHHGQQSLPPTTSRTCSLAAFPPRRENRWNCRRI